MVQTAEEDLISAGFEHNKPCLTWAQADAYLQDLRNQGRTPETIQTYRRNLMLLFEGLPESGQLDRGTLARWRDAMLERGYTPQTVNVRLAAANGFLDYIGLRDYQLSKRLKPAEDAVQPELTRNEYLRLLSAARVLGKERTYLLVKAFAVLGLSLHDLPNLTAEAVENGMLMTSANHSHQLIRIPNCLQVELRNYLQREGIQSGPVFRTRSGKTVNRTAATGCSSPRVFLSSFGGPISLGSVLHMLHRVLKRAGLPRVRFHDLRHTFATLALQNGVDIKAVSGMMGHFSAGFTLDTYAHVTTAAQKEAARATEEVLTAAL